MTVEHLAFWLMIVAMVGMVKSRLGFFMLLLVAVRFYTQGWN